jgi:hypothetical protein
MDEDDGGGEKKTCKMKEKNETKQEKNVDK